MNKHISTQSVSNPRSCDFKALKIGLIVFSFVMLGLFVIATQVSDLSVIAPFFQSGNTIVNSSGVTADSINNVLYVQAGNASDIQAKIDISSNNNVHIPCGEYIINNPISINNNKLYLVGDGECTILIHNDTDQSSNHGVIFNSSVNISYLELSNFVIDGKNKTVRGVIWLGNNNGYVHNMIRINHLHIKDINSTNSTTIDIMAYNSVIEDNLIEGVRSGIGIGSTGSYILGSNNIVSHIIRNNKIVMGFIGPPGEEGEGIDVNNHLDTNSVTLIRDNRIFNFMEEGIDCNSNTCNVIGNEVYAYPVASDNFINAAISIANSEGGKSALVIGNTIKQVSNRGISIQTYRGIVVSGNTIEGNISEITNGTTGISISGVGGNLSKNPDFISVNSNFIYGVQYGIISFINYSSSSSYFANQYQNVTTPERSDSTNDTLIFDFKGIYVPPNISVIFNSPINGIIGNISSVGVLSPHSSGISSYGLIGYFPLDSNVKDYSGNKINGNISGATNTVGKFGGAYSFDGVGNKITIDNASLFNFSVTADFTLSLWVKIDNISVGATEYILTKRTSGSSPGYYIDYRSTSGFGFSLSNTTGSEIRLSNSLTILQTNSSWHHIVGVFANSVMYLYVDGFTYSQQQFTLGGDITSPEKLSLGRRDSSSTSTLDGSIDEVMIYNRGLSNAEIVSLYESNNEKISKDAYHLIGFNITMISPNHNKWCCGVDNAGLFLCSAGACP